MRSRSFAVALAAAAAAALFAGAAAAQSAANLYVGGVWGRSDAKDACRGVADCEPRDNSVGVFGGYWFYPQVALEVAYHNLGKATAPGGTYIRSNVWELVALGAWRPVEQASLYAKFGAFRGAQEGGGLFAAPKELVTGVTYAFGAQLDLTQRLGVRVEWQNYPRLGGGPILPHGDIDVLRFGALWRFR
jgi:OmpA-OmpF porin, OOP family